MTARKRKCDVYRIARMAGVVIRDPGTRGFGPKGFAPRRPRECYAKRTLLRIGQAHGEGHLALVLRLIVETGHTSELYSETVRAISDLLVAHPELVERGTGLYDAFDGIDLAAIRGHARALALDLPLSHVMRVLIALRLIGPAEIGIRR